MDACCSGAAGISSGGAMVCHECTITRHIVLSSFPMNQLSVVSPSGLGLAQDSSPDARLIHIWLSTKTSRETRRAYAGEITRFLAFAQKSIAQVTLADLQAYAEGLAQGGLKIASQNRALTTIKSLLSFGQETGYLPFNVGTAVKLRPDCDRLAQRILEESEVAKLIEAAPEGRDRVLLKLLYVSGVRAGELCGLKWCDALPRQEGGQITVFGKGGKTRTILLKPKVWQQLLSVKGAASAVDSIFRSRNGGGQLDLDHGVRKRRQDQNDPVEAKGLAAASFGQGRRERGGFHLPQPEWRRPARYLPGPPHRLRRRPQGGPGEEGFTPLAASRPRQPCAGARRAHSPGPGDPGSRLPVHYRPLPPRPAHGKL